MIESPILLGFFVRNLFAHEAIYALVLGGTSMIVAGIMVMFVDDVDAVNK